MYIGEMTAHVQISAILHRSMDNASSVTLRSTMWLTPVATCCGISMHNHIQSDDMIEAHATALN